MPHRGTDTRGTRMEQNMNRNRAGQSILKTVAAVLLFGCGGGSTPPAIQVSITSISPEKIDQGQQATVTAIVYGDIASKGGTWNAKCPGSSCGSISAGTGSLGARREET